jgi:hypothetical protein
MSGEEPALEVEEEAEAEVRSSSLTAGTSSGAYETFLPRLCLM